MGTHRALRGGGTVDDSAFVQPDAYINGTASVGARSYLGHGVYVNAGVTIGTDCIICDRVRVIANVPNGTTITCDCCSSGGGGVVVPVISVDSVYTVGVRLSNIITTGMAKGTLAYVGNDTFAGQGSVHRYYTLVYSENNPTSGTDLEVVNSPTFATDGAQWVSLDTTNQQALLKRFWAIDRDNGEDENDGWGVDQASADAVPLKTMAELNRRLFGANYGDGVTVVFHQLSRLSDGVPLSNVRTSGTGYVLWLGTKFFRFEGAVTAFNAENPSFPESTTLQIDSIPTGWNADNFISDLIESLDEERCAFAMAEVSAKVARITTPCASSAVSQTISTVASVFVVDETVRIWTLSDLPVWPFTDDCQLAGAQYVKFTKGDANPVTKPSAIGGTTCFVTRTQLLLPMRATAAMVGIQVSGSIFNVEEEDANGPVTLSGGIWSLSFMGVLARPAFANKSLFLEGGAQLRLTHGDLFVQHCNIVFDGQSSLTTLADDAHIALFGVLTGPCLDSSDSSSVGRVVRCDPGTFLYGSGNQVQAASVAGGATMALPPVAQCVFGSTVKSLSVVGILYNFSDMPIVDANTLGGINEG